MAFGRYWLVSAAKIHFIEKYCDRISAKPCLFLARDELSEVELGASWNELFVGPLHVLVPVRIFMFRSESSFQLVQCGQQVIRYRMRK